MSDVELLACGEGDVFGVLRRRARLAALLVRELGGVVVDAQLEGPVPARQA